MPIEEEAMTNHLVTTMAELEAMYAQPMETSLLKELDHIGPHYRALIEAKGTDNGLHRTAISQQRHDDHDYLHRFAQALKHRPLPGTKCFPTRFTFIAWPFAAMDHDIALPLLSACLALQIGAKLPGSIHWLCWFVHTSRIAHGRFFFQLLGLFSTS